MAPKEVRFGLAIHGGSGVRAREEMTPELERDYRTVLRQSLTAGYEVLRGGGPSVAAVEAAIRVMEDSPLFNCGKGAAFTSAGTNELDASIMNGENLAAGGVAGVKHIRNPISLARLVMEKSPHVLMIGEGAEVFHRAARELTGLVDRAREEEPAVVVHLHPVAPPPTPPEAMTPPPLPENPQ